jgi:hypothetical protein
MGQPQIEVTSFVIQFSRSEEFGIMHVNCRPYVPAEVTLGNIPGCNAGTARCIYTSRQTRYSAPLASLRIPSAPPTYAPCAFPDFPDDARIVGIAYFGADVSKNQFIGFLG